jgi:hypothetical protein
MLRPLILPLLHPSFPESVPMYGLGVPEVLLLLLLLVAGVALFGWWKSRGKSTP